MLCLLQGVVEARSVGTAVGESVLGVAALKSGGRNGLASRTDGQKTSEEQQRTLGDAATGIA